MVGDPFLEAGIIIPPDIPYLPKPECKVTEGSSKTETKKDKRNSKSNMVEKSLLSSIS